MDVARKRSARPLRCRQRDRSGCLEISTKRGLAVLLRVPSRLGRGRRKATPEGSIVSEPSGTVVRLAGALNIQHAGRHATERDLAGRQPRLMFAVMVWEHGRMIPHGQIAEIVWPEQRPATWQPALRGLASKVRAAFDLVGLEGSSTLSSGSGCYRLDLPPGTIVDVEEAVGRVAQAASLLEEGADETARRLAGAARTVLSRPLLPGIDAPWLDRRRDELGSSLARCLEILGECRRRAGEHDHAAAVIEELLKREPFRETAWRLLMRTHAGAGSVAEALWAYERCRTVMADELGVDPSPETQELHAHLLRSSPHPLQGAGLHDEPQAAPSTTWTGAPYQGLRPFEEDDAPLFFGRDVEITALVERLATRRFVTVSGPSGSGKSSLVRAGLLPALRSGALPESDMWRPIVLVPGAQPIGALADALLTASREPAVRSAVDRLGSDEGALHDAVGAVLASESANEQLLLVVDQFEELFTLCPDPDVRERFVAAMLHAVRRMDSRLVVVITLRADFYGRTAENRDLAAALSTSQLVLPPLDGDGLQRAIEGPARLAGLKLENGLTGRILADVTGEPGALPFLQHALLELYERRADHVLTRGAYDDIGGVAGALARRAEEVWAAFDPEQQAIARRIMLRLIQPGDGTADTRRRTAVDELVADPASAMATEDVIAELAESRLVVTSADPATGERSIEISHEALLQGWPRLAGWVDNARAWLRIHRRLTEQSREWEAHDRHPDYLLTGTRLTQAREWTADHHEDVNPDERAFVAASLDAEEAAHRRRARIRRGVTTGLTVALLVVGTLAMLASTQRARAEIAEDRARSREVAAEASNQLDLDPELGLLLAIEAYEISPTAQAEAALRQALVRSSIRSRLHTVGPDPMVEVSPDGKIVASWAIGGAVTLWDLAEGTRLAELRDAAGDTPEGLISAIAFSPGARRLVASDLDGHAWIWRVSDGQLLHTVQWPTTGTQAAVIAQEGAGWTPDGSRFVIAGFDGIARLFDATSGAQLREVTGPGTSESPSLARVRFAPDGRRLAVEGAGGAVRVVDTRNGDTIAETEGHDTHLWALKISADGTRLVAASEDGSARIWDATNGQLLHTFEHDAPVRDVAVDPAGEKVLTGDANGNVRIWDTATGEQLVDLVGHEARVNQLRFDASGQRALTASLDGTARVWDADSGALLGVMIGSTQPVVDAEFTPDGQFVVTSGDDARTWRVPQGALSVIDAHDVSIHDLSFSPDGRHLATAGVFDGLARIIDTDSGQALVTLEHAPGSKPFIDISPDGSKVVTTATYQSPGLADQPDPPKVWDVDTGELLVTLPLPADDPLGVCGGRCAAGQAAFSPDGTHIAVAGFDGRVTIHDAHTGQTSTATEPLGGWLLAIDWSPDGTLLLTNGFGLDGPLVLDAVTGEQLHRLPGGEALSVGNSRFSPGGTLAAVATGSTVRIYELPSERLVAELKHRGAARDVAFSSDGTLIATASESGSGIWDVATQRQLVRFPGKGAFSVAFTPNGQRIAVGGTDGAIRLYSCDVCQPIDRMLELARARITRNLTPAERARFLHEDTTVQAAQPELNRTVP